ncbi:MAG TPA: hypothetical protein VGD71_41780 [Kribbella sp.]|jgi:hypothetical protein
MGWLQFTEKIIGHLLSWPVLAFAAIAIFRRQLAGIIGQIRSYEGLGQRLTFGDELAKAEEEAEELLPPEATQAQPDPETQPVWIAVSQQATSTPAAAILKSWVEVERATRLLAEGHGLQAPSIKESLSTLLGELIDQHIIPSSVGRVIQRLRVLRRQVAHGRHEPTAGEALTYVATARDVAELLATLTALKE